jgi:nucleoside-diphosphate-sugar epimerase
MRFLCDFGGTIGKISEIERIRWMRVLVIGGTGFIGTPLVARLTRLGHQVAVFSRGEKPVDVSMGAQHIRGERLRFDEVSGQVDAFDPEVTVDIFAMTLEETQPIFDVLHPRGGRYVMLSSCDVYKVMGLLLKTESGGVLEGLTTETSPQREKLYPYRGMGHVRSENYDKIPIEARCFEQFEDRGTVLRLPMIVGRGDPQYRFRDCIKQMADGRPAILLPETYATWRTTYGNIDNVVEAVVTAALDTRAGGEIFNVADTPILSAQEWYQEMARTVNWTGEVIVAPWAELPGKRGDITKGANFAQDLRIDASKIREHLEFEPVATHEQTLQEIAAWETAALNDIPADAFDYGADDAWLSKRSTDL